MTHVPQFEPHMSICRQGLNVRFQFILCLPYNMKYFLQTIQSQAMTRSPQFEPHMSIIDSQYFHKVAFNIFLVYSIPGLDD